VFYGSLFVLFSIFGTNSLSVVFKLRLLITTYGFWLQLTASDYNLRLLITTYGFWLLVPLTASDYNLRLLIATYGFWIPLTASDCHLMFLITTYGFWLPLWYLQSFLKAWGKLPSNDIIKAQTSWVHSGFWWGPICSSVVFFYLIVFVLYLVCPMLPVSLDCPFLIVPSVFSNVYWTSIELKIILFPVDLNWKQ